MGVSSEQELSQDEQICGTIRTRGCRYGSPRPRGWSVRHRSRGWCPRCCLCRSWLLCWCPRGVCPCCGRTDSPDLCCRSPTVQQHTEYGVVGHQVVQTGVKSVVAGHQFAVAGVEHLPQPATSYVAGVVKNSAVTVPIAPPVFPIAPAPLAAIPPAPRNLGPAPADTVTQQKILAPVRSHVRITPQATNIIPQINVQKYNVDVPVHVPTPIAREIIVNKHVAAPYNVAVPRAVPVAAPYKVHPVQEIVETPHIHHATYTTHSAQKVVTPVHTPVHAVSHEAVGVQRSVEHVGY